MTIPDLYKIRSPLSAVVCPRNQRNSAKTNVLLDGGFGLQGVVVGISISSSRTAKDAPCMAVVFAEFGLAPPLARGLFCLSRSVGAMAHGYEQMQQGGRNKGPTPPHYRWHYSGKD